MAKKRNGAIEDISISDKVGKFFARKEIIIAMVGIIVLCFFANYAEVFDHKLDPNGDNIYYFSLAQSLSNGDGFVTPFGVKPSPHMHFPPGYPLFMSVVMQVFPDNIVAMKWANGLLFLAAIVLLFFIIRQMTSKSTIALATCLLITLHAELLRWSTIIMSEMLYLLITTIMIWITLKLDTTQLFSKGGWKNWIYMTLLTLLVAYVYFVRTMGVSIILSLILWSLSMGIVAFFKNKKENVEVDGSLKHGKMWHWLIVCAILTSALLISKTSWDARNNSVVENFTSDYVGDFMKKPNGEVMTTMEDWTTRIGTNFKSYITTYLPDSILETGQELDEKNEPISGSWALGIIVFALLTYGIVTLKRGGIIVFLYVGITFAVMMIWPEQYSGLRYFVTLIPLLLLALTNGVWNLIELICRKLKKENIFVPAMAIALLLVILIPRYTAAQEEPRKTAKIKSWKSSQGSPMAQFITAAEWCGANLPDTALVWSRKPEIFYIYSNYHRSSGFPQYATPDSIMSLINRNGVDYVLLDNWFRHAYTTVYPAIIKNQEKFQLVQQYGEYKPERGMVPTMIFAYDAMAGYVGEKLDGKKHGHGVEKMADGRRYEGEFANDMPNGYGKLYDAKGALLFQGIWKDGRAIEATSDNPTKK